MTPLFALQTAKEIRPADVYERQGVTQEMLREALRAADHLETMMMVKLFLHLIVVLAVVILFFWFRKFRKWQEETVLAVLEIAKTNTVLDQRMVDKVDRTANKAQEVIARAEEIVAEAPKSGIIKPPVP